MKKIIILTAIIFLVCTGFSFAAQTTITTYMTAGNMGPRYHHSVLQILFRMAPQVR